MKNEEKIVIVLTGIVVLVLLYIGLYVFIEVSAVGFHNYMRYHNGAYAVRELVRPECLKERE